MADEIRPWWEKGDDEPDLDYGDAPADPNDTPEVAYRFERTELPESQRLSQETLDRLRQALITHRLSKGRTADGSKIVGGQRVESEDAPVTVLEPFCEVEISELPQTPRGLAKRAVAAGWEAHAGHSVAHHAATLYQSDSAPMREGESTRNQYLRGDVRFPAEDRKHWIVLLVKRAESGDVAAACRLSYETRPKKGAQKSDPTAFENGRLYDPVNGKCDIWPPSTIDGWKFVAGNAFTSAEFGEWFDTLVPPAAPKARDLRAKEEKQRDAALAEEVWQG